MPRRVQIFSSGHGYLRPQPGNVIHHLNYPGVVPRNDLHEHLLSVAH